MMDPISTAPGIERHRIEFTGSGSEYFRIWIVNLLLTLVTLGLYYPWAKVRKLKYLYRNTHVASHALDFHGKPAQMLKGYLLMGGVFLVYSMLSHFSPAAGSLVGIALAAAWPALIRASLRFRLANTSWRGLRFHFTGTTQGAYAVFVKPFAAALALGALAAILFSTHAVAGQVLGGLVLLCLYAGITPYLYFGFKRYQHENYAYAQLQTEFRATFKETLNVYLKTAGVALIGIMSCFVVVMIGAAVAGLSAMAAGGPSPSSAFLRLAPVLVVIGVVLIQIAPLPYFQSRMQNLLWSQTGSPLVRFKSDLAFWPLFRQSLLNWVLIALTLGLYWPFGMIAINRLKLQAITLHLRVDPDSLISQMQAQGGIGVGEAAADLAGIDIGI